MVHIKKKKKKKKERNLKKKKKKLHQRKRRAGLHSDPPAHGQRSLAGTARGVTEESSVI